MTYSDNNVQAIQNRKRWSIIGAVIILSFLSTSGCCGMFYYTHLSSFKGKVIDAETKEPIEGAVVLAVYYKSTMSIAGSNSYVAHGRETLTDAKGEFEIPNKCERLDSVKGWPSARLEIFKPGYGTLWHQRAKAVGENKSWPPPGKYIVYGLPRLRTVEERRKNVRSADRYSDIPYKNKTQYWEIVNQECVNVGIPPMTMTEEERQR